MQNNSNKNWENKGWEAIQQMLDQELPTDEKEPKRRLIFLYWAAGIAILAGTVFLNLQHSGFNFRSDNPHSSIAKTEKVENIPTKKTDTFSKPPRTPNSVKTKSSDNRNFTSKNIVQNKSLQPGILTNSAKNVSDSFSKETPSIENIGLVDSEMISTNDLSENLNLNQKNISEGSEFLVKNSNEIIQLPIVFADLKISDAVLPARLNNSIVCIKFNSCPVCNAALQQAQMITLSRSSQ